MDLLGLLQQLLYVVIHFEIRTSNSFTAAWVLLL